MLKYVGQDSPSGVYYVFFFARVPRNFIGSCPKLRGGAGGRASSDPCYFIRAGGRRKMPDLNY